MNPTAERLETKEPFVPPTTVALEAFEPTADRNPKFIVRPAFLVLFCAALLPLVALLRLGVSCATSLKTNEDGFELLVVLSIIGGSFALFGYATYTVVLLLP